MKPKFSALLATSALLMPLTLQAQGTLVFDQEAGTDSDYGELPFGTSNQFPGQTFSPSLNAVGFVTVYIFNGQPGITGTFYMNLRQGSPTGAVLAVSTPVTLTPQSGGPTEFVFPSPTPVTPGSAYYFEPIFQSGSPSWAATGSRLFNYAGGTAYSQGTPFAGVDLWFREGIFVPEPSVLALFLFGAGAAIRPRIHICDTKSPGLP